MTDLQHVYKFSDLKVYRLSRALSLEVFRLTQTFPKEETFSLIDQFRRSSRSIGAQIAEAWAKRLYEKHFISKLTDSDGELQETLHWIEIAYDCKYISLDQKLALMIKCEEIGKMLNGMILKSGQFCGPLKPRVGESPAEYFTDREHY